MATPKGLTGAIRGTVVSSHTERLLNGLEAGGVRYTRPSNERMPNLQDFMPAETESLFAEAIREHLELKARNAGLDGEMPLDPYLTGDPLENHPLFKSEEQARIEETLDGEPAAELSSERLPWPGEETVENVEGPALDPALWTGRPRDFDWGD
jgi:hypothetical protein